MARQRFIIEHPTRGVLKDLEWTDSEKQRDRFSPTASRTEGAVFYSLDEAKAARELIMPINLRIWCAIRREPTDQELAAGPFRGDPWRVVG